MTMKIKTLALYNNALSLGHTYCVAIRSMKRLQFAERTEMTRITSLATSYPNDVKWARDNGEYALRRVQVVDPVATFVVVDTHAY